MKHLRLKPFLGLQVFILPVLLATSGNAGPVWDAGKRIDRSHKGYIVDNGRVIVDLQDENSLCPVGFRRLARPQDAVREIVFRYQVAQAGRYWLHIVWNPGSSGKEQFGVLFNGTRVGTSQLIDGSVTPKQETAERFLLPHKSGPNEILLRYLSGDGLRFGTLFLSTEETPPVRDPVTATRKFPSITTLASYEKEIGEPGVILDGEHVRFYAPQMREEEARIVHGYLVNAYDELYRIVEMQTRERIVVYSLPKDSPYRLGRTTRCKIWYTYKNLEFETQEEWKRYRVPHVSGYIEEMAHNFVGASLAMFGNEMIGWSISKIVSEKVANNPIHRESLIKARKIQAQTFDQYTSLNNTFPEEIAVNLCDRIHAHLLYLCEKQYGPQFWPDFFKEIRKVQGELIAANESGSVDERRNARYRITIECFDRLMGGQFKNTLKHHGISLTTDVQSLHYKSPDWNRKLE